MGGGLLEQGLIVLRSGDVSSAISYFSQYLGCVPESPDGWFLLGAALDSAGRLPEAKQAFEKTLQYAPGNLQAHFALSSVSLALGDHSLALAVGEAATKLAPNDASALSNFGVAQEAAGHLQEAISSYNQALKLESSNQLALNNRGVLLAKLGALAQAIENNRLYVSFYPDCFEAWFNTGDGYLQAGQYEQASQAFNRTLELRPSDPLALLYAGFALALLERFAGAQLLLDRAAHLDPEMVGNFRATIFSTEWGEKKRLDARTLFLMRHFERVENCDWKSVSCFRQHFRNLIRDSAGQMGDIALAFRALALGLPPADQLQLARNIAAEVAGSVTAFIAPVRVPHALPRIRVGYLSANFKNHAVGLVARRLFAMHDKEQFEVFAYAIGPQNNDAVRCSIEDSVQHFADLAPCNDVDAAARIAADHIDVLIDLTGYADHARPGILAQRPAPVQIAAIAYPGSSGAPWVDYLVLDKATATLDIEQSCSESIIRLPHTMLPCSYAAHSPVPWTRGRAGLPSVGFVIAAFHGSYKIDPLVFALWMRLLAIHKDACLWLLEGSAEMSANLRQQACEHGVAPERLIFAPRVAHEHHLARLGWADIFLDTPQCNGGVTICDAMVAGVPVVTCLGDGIAQRMAAGILLAAGFPQGVTKNLAEYEERALTWISNPEMLREMRQQLLDAKATAPFYRLEQWVQHFEKAVTIAHQRSVQGLVAAPITIDEDDHPSRGS